jgi:hypothetical protein
MKWKKVKQVDRFKVSGQELCQHYNETTTLSRVFNDIERELKANSQVVCQFIVNGLALKEDDEEKFLGIQLKDVTTLEYLAENTKTLVEGVLGGWGDALPELIQKADSLCGEIRKNGIQHKLRDVRDLVDNCQFLISSIISLKTILGDSVIASQPKWDQAETWTQATLVQALEAFEKKDFVLLADVVEYDLNHGLQLWLEILVSVESIYTGKPRNPRTKNSTHSVDRKRLSN